MPVASFLLVMLLAALQARPDFRADVKVVRVDTEVSADARPVDGLTKEDFRVSDEGKLVEIVYFGHAEEPLDIMLVFDTSASMLPAIERVAEVSRAALGELRSDDRVAVMAFDKDTDLIADFTSDFDRVQTVVQDDVLRARSSRSVRSNQRHTTPRVIFFVSREAIVAALSCSLPTTSGPRARSAHFLRYGRQTPSSAESSCQEWT